MSDFGGTLTGGIQDLSALLPLIGTDQCEKHVGSALEGGFLYAAAAPLSLFGSPGIVKTGISVLIASFSVPALRFSRSLNFPLVFSGLQWCGARVLDDAGFKPMGTVAPMITMDKRRYAAESRLLQMLNEKHIDSPENLTVEWKSVEWNICLILCTIIAAVASVTPYIHLVLGAQNPIWIYPFLRTLGSSLAAVCCQFLTQARVISIMKNRIVFMVMHQRLLRDLRAKGMDKPELRLQNQQPVRWDANRIAEECLWSLENYLVNLPRRPSPPTNTSRANTPGAPPPSQPSMNTPTPMEDPFKDLNHDELLGELRFQHRSHFPNPAKDWMFVICSWIGLLFAIPAAIAGYVGSFTLASRSTSNGAAIWLGMEVALSVVRILLWAWNPGFDERTGVTVRLKLTEHEPLVTTEKDVEHLNGALPLVHEQRFLEFITRYTGPLEEFKGPGNIVLYFTLSGAQGKKCLFMTVFDANRRMAFVMYRRDQERLVYFNCSIIPDANKVEMRATLHSEIGGSNSWKENHPVLVNALLDYYDSLLHALNRDNPVPRPHLGQKIQWSTMIPSLWFGLPGQLIASRPPSLVPSLLPATQLNPITPPPSAILLIKWSFEPKAAKRTMIPGHSPIPRPLSMYDDQYLQQGYELRLKANIMNTWSRWLVSGMEAMYTDALLDCHQLIEEPTGNERAKQQELDQLSAWMALEWGKHELALLEMSTKLEKVIYSRVERVVSSKGWEWMRDWHSLEWSAGWKNRLEEERAQVKGRMEKVAQQQTQYSSWQWQESWRLVDSAWSMVISGSGADGAVPSTIHDLQWTLPTGPDDVLLRCVQERLKIRNSPLDTMRAEMGERIDRIRIAMDRNQLDQAYHYPSCSQETARAVYSRFACIGWLPRDQRLLAARLGVATVYDATDCPTDCVHAVIKNPFARSVVRIQPGLSIKENDHLLYLSDTSDNEVALPFIRNNRERWWTQQTSNSFTFYLTPIYVFGGAVVDRSQTIARLMVFLKHPASLRIRLLHRQAEPTILSIREGDKELRQIRPDEIPPNPRLHSFELDSELKEGRHELQLVVARGDYELWNVLVEFFDVKPPPQGGHVLPQGLPRRHRHS